MIFVKINYTSVINFLDYVMLYVLKKIMSTLLFLLLALGSFCMSLGIHAAAFDTHEHNHTQSESHHDITVADHHGWGEDVDCCNDVQELDLLVIKPSVEIDFSETVIYALYLYDQNIDYIALNTFRHQIFPHAPPEDITRRESEKKSTQLLI